jgi:hypothetical protein
MHTVTVVASSVRLAETGGISAQASSSSCLDLHSCPASSSSGDLAGPESTDERGRQTSEILCQMDSDRIDNEVDLAEAKMWSSTRRKSRQRCGVEGGGVKAFEGAIIYGPRNGVKRQSVGPITG